jgi:uncharacterized Zn finger protein (UPF0148 family)
MMQHCKECGAELPTNAVFCGRCGRKTMIEDEIDTNVNSDPIEDISETQSNIEMNLSDSQDTTSDNGEDEQLQIQGLPSENNVKEEEQTSYVTSEHENEKRTPYPASEKQQEQHSPYPTSEYESEEQIHQEYVEPAKSMPNDADSEPEILAKQFPDEQPQNAQTPLVPLEAQRSNFTAQKSGSRPISKCLLFSLASLIVFVGVVVVLMGLVHLNTPGFGGSSNAQSNSSKNETINPNGSSLTASICVKTSTPSTNPGSTFVLISSSGCSTVTASKADSSCLIFPNASGASRKFIFDVSSASIDSKPYHLVLGIVNYTGSTTYNDASHVSIGLSEGSTGRNFSWLYHSGNVFINNDEQSGTMDVILEAVNGANTIHIVGDWACGSQLKNT